MRPSRPSPGRRALAALASAAAAALAGCSGSDTPPDSGTPDAGQSSTIAFESVSSSGDESQALVQIPVVLTQLFRVSSAVVDVQARGTAAGNGEDYALSQTILTIPAGESRGTVDLDIVSDSFDEPDETIEITLSNPRTSAGDTLTVGVNQTHVYTIRAQSTSLYPTLSFSSMSSQHLEATPAVIVTLTLSRPSTTSVSVSYGRVGGTASPTADFNIFNPGTVTFPPGVTTQTITLSPRDDALDEDDETVVIGLSNPMGEVMLGGATVHTVVLTDDDPAPTVEFAAATLGASEGDPSPSVPVILSAPSGRTVTATYAVTGGTATGAGVDYTLNPGTVTFAAGITARSIPINLSQDSAVEGSENVLIALGSPTGALLGANANLDLTILDDDVQPTVGFSAATGSAAENAVSAILTVALSNPYGSAVNVAYSVTGGSATSGSDYTLAAGTLVFTAGTTTRNITLNILNDSVDEDDETVVVTLNSPMNASLGVNSAHTFTITDEDPPPVLTFASPTTSSGEATPSASLSVTLAPASARTVTVNYSVTGGNAVGGGTDYTLAAGTLSFVPGVTLQTIPVPVVNDALDEDNETVVVTLASPINAGLGTYPSQTLSITDDDAPPTVGFATPASTQPESVSAPSIPVVLSAPSGRSVTVSFVAGGGGTATNGTDYSLAGGSVTFAAGVTSMGIPITVVDDAISEPSETVLLTLGGATNATLSTATAHTFTVTDDDSAPTVQFALASSSGGEATTLPTLTVTLSNPSAQTITVAYSVTGGSATTADYLAPAGTLTFAAGVTSRPLNFSVINDNLDEADETIVFTLATPTNATLGTPGTHTYTIVDNENPPSVQFQLAATTANENAGATGRAVTLSAASGQTVTVDFAVSSGTATGSGTDYTLNSGTLSFNPGTTSLNVPITIVEDAVDENDETVIVMLSAPSNATLGTNQLHTLTILDNDPLPVVTFTSGSSSGAESAATVTLGVQMTQASARTVTVNYAAAGGNAVNGTDYVLMPGSLILQPGETTASFQLSVTDDMVAEGNETIVISLSIPTPITAALGSPANHTYTIQNDD